MGAVAAIAFTAGWTRRLPTRVWAALGVGAALAISTASYYVIEQAFLRKRRVRSAVSA